jgi:large subunit ribosomal protein L10
MSKQLKQWMAEEVRTDLESATNLLVVGLLPMDASKNHGLRTMLRAQGARLRVIHNRTSRHALPGRHAGLAGHFRGQTAIALADPQADVIAVAKARMEAARGQHVEIRGGFVDGEVLDRDGVEVLARSPDKQTLRGMLAGAIVGPGRGLAGSIHAVCAGIARCLRARSEKNGVVPAE